MIHTSHHTVVFTDGSSRGNPGPGGFGAVIVHNDSALKVESGKWKVKEIGGREEHTTNNRMELRAAIGGLKGLTLNREKGQTLKAIVYSDSSYVINGITKWVFGWQKNGWKTKAKKDVENKDLWEKLVETSRNKEIEWKKIEGHAGVAGNVRCDEIATAFADNLSPKLYADVLENYSIKNILDVPRGQTSNRERGQTSNSKKRAHAAAYSYVSLVDGKIEIHKTWAECEKRVKGKRGARYKKVFSADEERALVAQWRT